MIKAIPVLDGRASKSALYALRAPTEPPMPTMKLGCNAPICPAQIACFPSNTITFAITCLSPRNTFTNLPFLMGGDCRYHQHPLVLSSLHHRSKSIYGRHWSGPCRGT